MAQKRRSVQERNVSVPAVLERPHSIIVDRLRPVEALLSDRADLLGEGASELVDGDRGERVLVHAHSDNDHLIASYRWGRPASGRTSPEAAARLLSGHARRSR